MLNKLLNNALKRLIRLYLKNTVGGRQYFGNNFLMSIMITKQGVAAAMIKILEVFFAISLVFCLKNKL